MTECPDKFPLSWLLRLADDDKRFTAEALEILLHKDSFMSRPDTRSIGSSTPALIRLWLNDRELTCYQRGRLVDNFGEFAPIAVDGDFGPGLDAIHDSIHIMRDELIALMRSYRMTIPWYLGGSGEKPVLATADEPLSAPASTPARRMQPKHIDVAPVAQKVKRVIPTGGDSLTPIIWEICYDLRDAGVKPTGVPVMAELKIRALESDQRRKGPLVGTTAGGVHYEYARGDQRELTSVLLKARIQEWKKVNPD